MDSNISFKEVASFIYKVVKPFKSSILIMVLVAITDAAFLSLQPYLLKMIVDALSQGIRQDVFKSVGLLAMIYFASSFILSTVYRFYDYFVTIKMMPNLQRNIDTFSFDSFLKQSYSYYQNTFSGDLVRKMGNLAMAIPEVVQIIFDQFFNRSITLIIAVCTLWYVSPLFAMGMLSWSLIFICISLLLLKRLTILAEKWSACTSDMGGQVVDSLTNALSVRLFARSKAERDMIHTVSKKYVQAEQNFQWTYFWMWLWYGYSFVIIQGLNLYLLLKGYQEGWVTPGDFIVVIGINSAIVNCLWEMARTLSQFSKAWGKIIQSLQAIQAVPEIQDKPNAAPLKVKKGQIVFDNVRFHYKGADPLFQNKSVTIEAGQKVGLVGYSGGGKTTFVNLILRLYDVSDGRIMIDGQSIQDTTQDSLRASIGMIPQDPSLFHRSLMDNIRYGRMDASDKEVIMAAKHAHAHEFIIKLAQGYESLVGERGVKLSGGQRQRIAIARAFLKDAPILVLDEATSQLDSVTEGNIQESLWKLMQGKTTIVIAHRLSTLLNMDRILVFDNGIIVDDGSHKELLSRGGLYKVLWDAQVGGFLPDERS